MPDGLFWVRYLNGEGVTRSSMLHLTVNDPTSARLQIERQHRGVVIQLWQAPSWLARTWRSLLPVFQRAWPIDELADFFHSLGIMLKSGLPVDTALRDLLKDIRHGGIRTFAAQLHAAVSAGNTISSVLVRFDAQMPPSVRALVAVGEQSGNLDHSLMECANHLKRMRNIRQDIGKALIYPIFALTMVAVAVTFWVGYVLPDMSRMFIQMGAKLPSYTRAAMSGVMAAEKFLTTNFGLTLIAMGILAVAMLSRIRVVRQGAFRLLYRLPISGLLIKSSAMALITEHLALLIRAGVPLVDALRILAEAMRQPFYTERLQAIRSGVERGNSLTTEMSRSGVFPPLVIRLVSVGEQSGTLDQQLEMLAGEYRRQLAHVIDTLGEILKPLLIIVAGLLFVVVVVVFLLPIYQMIAQVMR